MSTGRRPAKGEPPSNPVIEAAQKVTAKRAKTVIDHIIAHGHVTTAELKDLYGYNHPPRAARDVREEGIPLETTRVKGPDGRKIGAYTFADPADIKNHTHQGRKTIPKALKEELYALQQGKCAVCSTAYESRYLQVDHRVPYEVAGDSVTDMSKPEPFMLLCGSCQRSKSWSCEHCENGTVTRDPAICVTCYWANPSSYTHIATVQSRRLSMEWTGVEVVEFDDLQRRAQAEGTTVQALLKKTLGK